MDPFTLQLLQLALVTLLASSAVAATAALAATLGVKPNNNDNNNAARQPSARENALSPAAQSNVPLAIWAAAQALANDFPEGQSTPEVPGQVAEPNPVVINGVTIDVQPGAWPTPILPPPSSPPTVITSSNRPTRTNNPTRTRRPTSRTRLTSTPRSTPTSTSTTSQSTTSTTSMSTSTPTPTNRFGYHHGPSEKVVAAAIGAFLILISLSLMACIFWMLWRRKNTTGSFFKPVRYSLASVAQEPVRDRNGIGSFLNPAKARDQAEDEKGLQEEDQPDAEEEAAPAPFVPTTPRSSTIRQVEASPNYATFPAVIPAGRKSVERLRSKKLVSSRSRVNLAAAEMEGDRHPFQEFDSSPSERAATRLSQRLWSAPPSDGEATPRATPRPLVVMHSPTTSSSDMLQSRENESYGESRDGLGPIAAPMPSYRDRRPVDLKLPTANHRFRDQRLTPMVHFSNDSTPGISPIIQGGSRTPSPSYYRDSPVVHYPSYTEISEFDFTGDGSSPPRRPVSVSPEYGDDGWRRDGDRVFGRYELG